MVSSQLVLLYTISTYLGSCFLWELMLQLMHADYSLANILHSLQPGIHSFLQLSELVQCKMNKLAQVQSSYKRIRADSNTK